MNIPRSLTVGDATSWTDSFQNYKASLHTLTYALVGTNRLILTAVPDGDNFVTSISLVQSNVLVAGIYSAQAAIANVGTIGIVQVNIKPNLAAIALPYVAKTTNQIRLEQAQKAYDNAISGKKMYEIAGNDGFRRKAENHDLKVLLDHIRYWETQVAKERFANGDRPNPRIEKVGFV